MKNKRLTPLYLSPIVLLALTGCFVKPVTPETPDTPEQPDVPVVVGEEPALADSEEYKEFWNPTSNLSINIKMSQEAADFINEYQSNHDDSTYFDYYVPCDFTLVMNGKTYNYEEVGIRQKGNMSRTHILMDNNFSLGSLSHYKLSFKETFDDEEYTTIGQLNAFAKTWEDNAERKTRKNRTLFDMEKIDIKWNRNNDESKSKQSFALKVFRSNGVLAGNDTLATTTIGINGKTPITTTYEIFECIDSVFVKRHFDTARADGDLYKCTYTNRGPANLSGTIEIGNQIGVENNVTGFHPCYDLKTNKKKNTTHTNFFNFVNIVNKNSLLASQWKSQIEQVMDMESFIKYESIAFLLGNFDDMRNNANNYYLYFTSGDNPIAYVIPYDFDRCLGAGCEGRKDFMTDFSAESTKMQCSGEWQTISLFWRICCTSGNSESGHQNVQRIEEYRQQYQENIEDLLNNKIMSTEAFTNYVNSFPSDYRGLANGAGEGNISFAEYLTKKISKIKECNPTYDIKVS